MFQKNGTLIVPGLPGTGGLQRQSQDDPEGEDSPLEDPEDGSTSNSPGGPEETDEGRLKSGEPSGWWDWVLSIGKALETGSDIGKEYCTSGAGRDDLSIMSVPWKFVFSDNGFPGGPEQKRPNQTSGSDGMSAPAGSLTFELSSEPDGPVPKEDGSTPTDWIIGVGLALCSLLGLVLVTSLHTVS